MNFKIINKLKITDFIFAFIYLFFVVFQYLRLFDLNLSYLGEEISFNIVPVYTFILLFIPVVVFMFIYLPGLCIISINISIKPIKVYLPDFKLVKNISKPYLINIISVFSTRYKVLRC